MKLLTMGVLLCAPALGQTQTFVQTVDLTGFQESGSHVSYHEGSFYAPQLPGRALSMTWDLDLAISGHAFMANPFPEARYIRGMFHGWTIWVNAPWGPVFGNFIHQFESPLLNPGENALVPFWDVWDLQGSLDTPGGTSFLGAIHASNPEIETWSACLPGQLDCIWLWPNYAGPSPYRDVSYSLTGTITWEFEPTLGGVVAVCDGDGTMDLDLVGDWNGDVRAWSSEVYEFSMLFMGPAWRNWPGTEFCVDGGQRINESLRYGRVDHVLEPSTILAGQTFVLQAVHRVQGGGVAFSNAILAFPF